jgi:hypothetical protein
VTGIRHASDTFLTLARWQWVRGAVVRGHRGGWGGACVCSWSIPGTRAVTILPQSVTVTYTQWPRRQEPAGVHPDLHVSGWPRVTVAADCVPTVASRSMFSTRTSCQDLTGDSRAGTQCSQAIVAAVLPGVASQTMLFCIANDRALCTRSYVSVQMTPVLRGHVKARKAKRIFYCPF